MWYSKAFYSNVFASSSENLVTYRYYESWLTHIGHSINRSYDSKIAGIDEKLILQQTDRQR